jgi:methylenetetrahydrofolate reductase (NADPH)
MRIAEILEQRRPVFSFEFFPPKTEEGQRTLGASLEVLRDDAPDFVSMTYGAGGSTRDATVELTRWIKHDLGIEAMAHLSCVGEPRERLLEILRGMPIRKLVFASSSSVYGDAEAYPTSESVRPSLTRNVNESGP